MSQINRKLDIDDYCMMFTMIVTFGAFILMGLLRSLGAPELFVDTIWRYQGIYCLVVGGINWIIYFSSVIFDKNINTPFYSLGCKNWFLLYIGIMIIYLISKYYMMIIGSMGLITLFYLGLTTIYDIYKKYT